MQERGGVATRAEVPLLADLHFRLRGLLEGRESELRKLGLTPRQHEALLQIGAAAQAGEALTVGALARRLHILHHSAVELADRLERAGLLTRQPDHVDRRRIFLHLTAEAERVLATLAAAHLTELDAWRRTLTDLLGLLPEGRPAPAEAA